MSESVEQLEIFDEADWVFPVCGCGNSNVEQLGVEIPTGRKVYRCKSCNRPIIIIKFGDTINTEWYEY